MTSNIGEASDQEISSLAVAEHLIVSIPADTEIYVVLQKPAAHTAHSSVQAGTPSIGVDRQNLEELRQLLQLQREMNQQSTAPTSRQ